MTAWIDRAAARPEASGDREIALNRIDMIAADDALPRLGGVRQPSLVICGDLDSCTPLPLSEEIARAIPGCQIVVVTGCGHFVEIERPEEFFRIASTFIDQHEINPR